MQLIDLVTKHAGQQIATDSEGAFIYWGSWQPVPTETVAAAQAEFAELELKHKVDEINQRVCEMIAEQYSITDEIKLIRTAPSHEFDVYNEHAEACRRWGREQKALLDFPENVE